MNNKPSDRNRPEIPEGTDPEALSAACHGALRTWTLESLHFISASECKNLLFSEALGLAQNDHTPDELAVLLRGMAARIEAGELGGPSIQ